MKLGPNQHLFWVSHAIWKMLSKINLALVTTMKATRNIHTCWSKLVALLAKIASCKMGGDSTVHYRKCTTPSHAFQLFLRVSHFNCWLCYHRWLLCYLCGTPTVPSQLFGSSPCFFYRLAEFIASVRFWGLMVVLLQQLGEETMYKNVNFLFKI